MALKTQPRAQAESEGLRAAVPATQSRAPRALTDVRNSNADQRLREIFRVHGEPLYSFVLHISFGQPHLSEDIVQETMLRAWRNMDALIDHPALIRAWLFTVARRIAIDTARARRARPHEDASVDVALTADPTDPVDRMLTRCTIVEALNCLSPKHRMVIVEVYLKGQDCAGAARTLRIPEGTVKSRTHFALRALRTQLTHEI